MEEDVVWKNKKEFLSLPLDKVDKFNVAARTREALRPDVTGTGEIKGREFS